MKLTPIARIAIILSLVFLNISCDQLSKRAVRKSISTNERIEIIKDSFIVTKVENTGAAYSWGSNLSPLVKLIILQIIPVIVLLMLLILTLVKKEYPKAVVLGFSFVIGGGIGNVFDRIVHGSVTDFMYINVGFFETEIFNMADVSIILGALIVLIHTLTDKTNSINLKGNLG